MSTKYTLSESNRPGMTRTHGLPPDSLRGFGTVDELLESAVRMITARSEWKKANEDDGTSPQTCQLRKIADAWTQHWHRSLSQTDGSLPIWSWFKRYRLNRMEREILIVLVLEDLGLLDQYVRDVEDILKLLCLPPKKMLNGLRCLSEEGRLYRNKLVGYKDLDDPLVKRELIVDPSLPDSALHKCASGLHVWPVRNQTELYEYMRRLTRALKQKSEELKNVYHGYHSSGDAYKHVRRVAGLIRGLSATLLVHTGWPLSILHEQNKAEYIWSEEWVILLALLGKELGHLHVEDDLFEGAGLARAASPETEYHPSTLGRFRADAPLRKHDWIQPCGGDQVLISDDTTDLESTEFELTEKAKRFLKLDPKIATKKHGNVNLRTPRISLADLVHSESVRQSLEIAVTQARHAGTLFRTWGLGESILYGRGVTMLFAGPPGTGKTASAEALAGELKKDLLVVNYARIQDCFVGQTEKNIVATFREARAKDAVLFWDEADAMFYDRNLASRTWEVRDVNVLLQEIERFDGVCILATNRKITLDKALERRITLKVEFEPPNRESREAIFKKLIPAKMPLARDVTFDKLSDLELSGGEIKNVILNAARIALHRGGTRTRIAMRDFDQALELSRKGALRKSERRSIGFRR
ncbi:MAG: hypothetical protein AMXMBFR82_24040 [Candidatus Hydrogenedentota bacterium]